MWFWGLTKTTHGAKITKGSTAKGPVHMDCSEYLSRSDPLTLPGRESPSGIVRVRRAGIFEEPSGTVGRKAATEDKRGYK